MKKIFVTVILFLSLYHVAHADISSGLINHWRFDDGAGTVARDSAASAYSKNGTLTGTALPTWVAGKIGAYALGSFSGANANYVGVTNPSSTAYNGPLTIALWVNWNGSGTYQGFVSKTSGSGSTNSPFDFRSGNGDGTIHFIHSNATLYSEWHSNGTISTNAWHHVAVVVSSSDCSIPPTFYIDGIQQTTNTDVNSCTGSVTDPGDNILIGTRADLVTQMNGSLDDVCIYRRALSATDISQLYSSPTGCSQSNIISHSLYGPSTLFSGLVGWWTFDGNNMQQNVTDSSAQGYNGAMHGFTSTSTAIQPGKIGQALAVTSTSQYVQAPTITQISSGDMTFAGWFYFNTLPTNQWLLSQWDSTPSGPALFMQGNGIDWEVGAYSGSVLSNAALSAGRWYHIVGTLKGTTLTLYVNGKQDAQSTGYTPAYNSTAPFTISNNGSIGSIAPMSSGYVDDVRVYNRALSASEVYQLYNTGVSKISISNVGPGLLNSGLVGWWTFDGKDTDWSTGKTKDKTTNGNDGTFTSMSTTTSPIPGKMGQAIYLNSAGSNYVQLLPNLSSVVSGDFTVSGWINLENNRGSNYLIDLSGAGITHDFITLNSCGFGCDAFGATLNFSTTNASVQSSVNLYPGDTLTPTWYLVTVTYTSSTNTLHIYQNGKDVSSSSVNGVGTLNIAGAIQLNRNSFGSIGSTPYAVDDVRVYNRALSAQEILQLYNLGK